MALRDAIPELSQEIKTLTPIVANPEVKGKVPCDNPRIDYTAFQTKDGLHVISINTDVNKEQVTFQIEGAQAEATVFFENRTTSVTNGALKGVFKPIERHVDHLKRRPNSRNTIGAIPRSYRKSEGFYLPRCCPSAVRHEISYWLDRSLSRSPTAAIPAPSMSHVVIFKTSNNRSLDTCSSSPSFGPAVTKQRITLHVTTLILPRRRRRISRPPYDKSTSQFG